MKKGPPVPRYYQARLEIEKNIEAGIYCRGDRLPSERELSHKLGVSMITIRRAIEEMADDRIVEKQWGRGIFVKKKIPPHVVADKRIAFTVLHGEENLTHPAVAEILYGAGEAINDTPGVSIEIAFISQAMLENTDYHSLYSKKFDGVIVSVQEISAASVKLLKKKTPCVIGVNRIDIRPSVAFDYEDATIKIMEHLYSRGHRRIAFIGGVEQTSVTNVVFETYKKFLRGRKITPDRNIIRFGAYLRSIGAELMKDILYHTKNVTAVLAGDDNMALGAIEVAANEGLSCPGDISVCAFNDFPIASVMKPGLTTISVPFREMGRLAGNILAESVVSGCRMKTVKLKGELIVRDSVRSLQKGHHA